MRATAMTADPTGIDPVAIAEVKAYLRVEHAAEDALIGRLIAAATGHAEGFTGQALIVREVSEAVPVQPHWRRLSRTPVGAITAVAGMAGADDPFPLPVGAYAVDIDAAGDGWVRITAAGAATRATVRYQAGIASGWNSLPEPIRQGIVRLASHLYTHRDAEDEGAPPRGGGGAVAAVAPDAPAMSGLAGRIRERVALWRPTGGLDALGGSDGEDWTLIGLVWASVEPEGRGALSVGDAASAMSLWRATLRPCAVAVGDRIDRTCGTIMVREVRHDPRLPDRVIAIGEERR